MAVCRHGPRSAALVERERVALAVGPGSEPPHARDLLLARVIDRAAELLDLRDRRVDVVDVDVVPGHLAGHLAALAHPTSELAGARRVERVALEALHVAKLPAEDAAVEALRPRLVVERDLGVVVLAVSRHGASSTAWPPMPGGAAASRV